MYMSCFRRAVELARVPHQSPCSPFNNRDTWPLVVHVSTRFDRWTIECRDFFAFTGECRQGEARRSFKRVNIVAQAHPSYSAVVPPWLYYSVSLDRARWFKGAFVEHSNDTRVVLISGRLCMRVCVCHPFLRRNAIPAATVSYRVSRDLRIAPRIARLGEVRNYEVNGYIVTVQSGDRQGRFERDRAPVASTWGTLDATGW